MKTVSHNGLKSVTTLALAALLLVIIPSLWACRDGNGSVNQAILDADSTLERAYELYDEFDFQQSIDLTRVAMGTYERQHVDSSLSDCYSNLSACYQRLGEVDSGINMAIRGMEIDERMGDKRRLSSTYNNLAALYTMAGRAREAKAFINKAIDIEQSLDDPANLSIRYGIAAEIALKLDENENALDYINKAIDIDRNNNDTLRLGRRISVLGDIYTAMGQAEKAITTYSQAIDMLDKVHNNTSLMITYQHLARVYNDLHRDDRAIEYFTRSAELAEQSGIINSMQQSYEALAHLYKEKNPARAIDYMSRSMALKDSISQQETEELTARYSVQFQAKEKQLTIEQQQAHINRTHFISALIAIFAVILLGGILFLAYILRLRARGARAASKAQEMRDNFFTNLVYELRTPLTVIQGEAQLLDNEESSPQKRRRLKAILNQGNIMLDFVSNLLNVTKVTDGNSQLNWHTGDVVAMARMITEHIRVKANEARVSINFVPQHETIEMDFVPDYFYHIFTNLLVNAVKFTPRGGQVDATLKIEHNNVVLNVADTGKGIDPQVLPHIFEPFSHSRDYNNNITNVEIELALIRFMTEAMNGTIDVASIPGQGTLFTITVPVKHENSGYPKWLPEMLGNYPADRLTTLADESDEAQAATTGNESDEPTLALVVEDNPDVARYIGSVLTPLHIKIIFASNGLEGYEKAVEFVPNIIITDLMMPQMSGEELCRKVRDHELINHVPIIVITARDNDRDRIRCIEAGADAYLVKPINSEVLQVRVNKLLERQQALQEKYTQHDELTASGNGGDVARGGAANAILLERINNIIQAHIASPDLNSALLADKLCLSQRQLNRKVKSITGTDTTSLIRDMRIALAKRLLVSTDDPVSDIVVKCGFDSPSYFAKTFKQITGLTPTEYRRNGH